MKSQYVYKFLDGTKVTINPEDVGGEMIEILRKMDDKEKDPLRRDIYHKLQYLDAYDSDERGDADHNPYLADEDADPMNLLIKKIDKKEHQETLARLKEAIADLTPEQQDLIDKKFYQEKTVAEIATEKGVTKPTIYNRLNKIYAILIKNIEI